LRPGPGANGPSLVRPVARFRNWLRSLRPASPRAAGEDWPERAGSRQDGERDDPAAGPGGGAAAAAGAALGASEVARLTRGDELGDQLRQRGYLEVRPNQLHGLTYRVQVGRRVQLLWERSPGRRQSPWPYDYLCITPTYPLPAEVFAAQFYLSLRDREEEVIQVGIPQPHDDRISHVF
jgi:hypothetical protein